MRMVPDTAREIDDEPRRANRGPASRRDGTAKKSAATAEYSDVSRRNSVSDQWAPSPLRKAM
jgi:hypothetical protein